MYIELNLRSFGSLHVIGGIGQPMSLLMAMDENVGELCVQDVTMALVPAAGVAADLSHLEKKCKVRVDSPVALSRPFSDFALRSDSHTAGTLSGQLCGASATRGFAGRPHLPEFPQSPLGGIDANCIYWHI